MDDCEGHGRSRILIWSVFLAIVMFLMWAHWAQLDQITHGTGKIIANSRNQVIQASDGGALYKLYVREGAHVKRNQLLLRFDNTKTEAAYLESKAKMAALMAVVARLHAEIYDEDIKFPKALSAYPTFCENQRVLFHKRQSLVEDELSAMQESMNLAHEELEMNMPLLETGDVSKSDIIKLQRQLVDIKGKITNRRNQYFQDIQAELSKTQEDLEFTRQIVKQRKEELDHSYITSPMDGVVRNISITTTGGVARAGEEVMQIVPVNDELIVEVKVHPKDIAFVKVGLPAAVKLDAYDYSIYGTLDGSVSYISVDTLKDDSRAGDDLYYRVRIKTSINNIIGRYNESIEMQVGMTVSVDIKTGTKSVLEYLTKPITKTISESMGER